MPLNLSMCFWKCILFRRLRTGRGKLGGIMAFDLICVAFANRGGLLFRMTLIALSMAFAGKAMGSGPLRNDLIRGTTLAVRRPRACRPRPVRSFRFVIGVPVLV